MSTVVPEAEVLLETATLLDLLPLKGQFKFAIDDPQTPQLIDELPPEQRAIVKGICKIMRIGQARVEGTVIASMELAAKLVW